MSSVASTPSPHTPPQPQQRCNGYISTQLHRGIGSSATFVNVAVWESTGHLRAAVADPAFKETTATYPDCVEPSPHVFTKQAAPDICTD